MITNKLITSLLLFSLTFCTSTVFGQIIEIEAQVNF